MFSKPPPPPITLEKARKAAKVLDLELVGLTENHIRAAFRGHVKLAHPDSLMRMAEDAPSALDAAKNARDTLMEWLSGLPDDSCTTCRGSGYVRSGGFGASKMCPKCFP